VGRLSRVEKVTRDSSGDAVIRNVYDSSDTRVIRLDEVSTEGSGQATLYISAGYEVRDATVQADGTYSGGEETKYVFAGDQRVARVVEQTQDSGGWPNPPGEPYAFHTLTNHLGSASVTFTAIPDGSDDIVVAQTQLAYGTEDARVESPSYGGWHPDYELTDKEQDPDVGLMYFGARFYAPALGRWVSADPLVVHRLESDENTYRYAIANPPILVDPNGLIVKVEGWTGEVQEGSQGAWSQYTVPDPLARDMFWRDFEAGMGSESDLFELNRQTGLLELSQKGASLGGTEWTKFSENAWRWREAIQSKTVAAVHPLGFASKRGALTLIGGNFSVGIHVKLDVLETRTGQPTQYVHNFSFGNIGGRSPGVFMASRELNLAIKGKSSVYSASEGRSEAYYISHKTTQDQLLKGRFWMDLNLQRHLAAGGGPQTVQKRFSRSVHHEVAGHFVQCLRHFENLDENPSFDNLAKQIQTSVDEMIKSWVPGR
jgi:RHS repeat-associated protein